MELSIGDEVHSLTLCANMAGFGKAGHILYALCSTMELLVCSYVSSKACVYVGLKINLQ